MIKAVIIDDEQHCIDRLQYLVKEYCATAVEVLGAAGDVESGLALVGQHQPQLVFLDVQLGAATGFELLQKFVTVPFQVVFTTAHEQYAVQAFKFSAVDYLLKPIDPDELMATIRRVQERMAGGTQAQQMEVLLQHLQQLKQQVPRITIPTATGLELLRVADILRCQSDGNYTTIFMRDKKTLVVAKTLKEFEQLLSGYDFCRIHQSHLVNLACVTTYHKGKGGYVKLEDRTELEVSSRRRDEFLQKLASLK